MEVAFWRAVLAWVCFGSHAVLAGQVRVRRRDLPTLLAFSVTGVTLFYGSYQLAVNKGGAALAAVLLYTAPAWVTVLSRFFFQGTGNAREVRRPGDDDCRRGQRYPSVPEAEPAAPGRASSDVTACACGLTAGCSATPSTTFSENISPVRYDSPTIFLYILPLGALMLLPWVTFVHKTAAAWGALAVIAFFSTYLAYALYYAGLRQLEPSRAAITATLEPVIAAVVAYIWWQEVFTFIGYVGGGLILFSVVLIIWDGMRRERKQTAAARPAD